MTAEARKIKAEMEMKGTYREEYLPTIARLANMRKEHARLEKRWSKMVNERPLILEDYHKPLAVTRLENLSRDILAHERALGLTNDSQRTAADQQQQVSTSPTERLLQSLEDDDL